MFTRFSMFSKSGNHVVLRPLCFGKLPLSRDFLKLRGGGASRAFQDWINTLDRPGAQSRSLPHAQRVLFIPEGENDFIVGTLWNSSDEGGGRVFPFALYCEPSRRFLEANRERPVLASLQLWHRLEKEQSELAAATSTAEFYQRLRQVRFSLSLWGKTEEEDRSFDEEAAAVSVRNLAEGLFGEEPLDDWVRLLWRLTLAVRSGDRGSRVVKTLALRLPLARGISYPLQVEAWLGCIRKRVGASSLVPSVILPQAVVDGPASFAFYFRPLRESDVRLLQGESENSDLVDLTASDPDVPVTGYGDFRQAVADWFERSEADLRSILPDIRAANGSFT